MTFAGDQAVITGVGQSAVGLKLGRDFLALTLSIDPSETSSLAAERKAGHLQSLGEATSDPSWTFATGAEDQIRALARSVGFGYSYDEDTKQYAHAAVIFVLTPAGKISRYLYGIEYGPRDLKLALLAIRQFFHRDLGTRREPRGTKCRGNPRALCGIGIRQTEQREFSRRQPTQGQDHVVLHAQRWK